LNDFYGDFKTSGDEKIFINFFSIKKAVLKVHYKDTYNHYIKEIPLEPKMSFNLFKDYSGDNLFISKILGHFTLSLFLGILLSLSLITNNKMKNKYKILIIILVGFLIPFLVEFIQYFIPGRFYGLQSISDILLGFCGILLGNLIVVSINFIIKKIKYKKKNS